jgi:hypothetical protein
MAESFFSMLKIHKISKSVLSSSRKNESRRVSPVRFPHIFSDSEKSSFSYNPKSVPIKVVKIFGKKSETKFQEKSKKNNICISGNLLSLRAKLLLKPNRKSEFVAKIPGVVLDINKGHHRNSKIKII